MDLETGWIYKLFIILHKAGLIISHHMKCGWLNVFDLFYEASAAAAPPLLTNTISDIPLAHILLIFGTDQCWDNTLV